MLAHGSATQIITDSIVDLAGGAYALRNGL